jgi:hypothetical protein
MAPVGKLIALAAACLLCASCNDPVPQSRQIGLRSTSSGIEVLFDGCRDAQVTTVEIFREPDLGAEPSWVVHLDETATSLSGLLADLPGDLVKGSKESLERLDVPLAISLKGPRGAEAEGEFVDRLSSSEVTVGDDSLLLRQTHRVSESEFVAGAEKDCVRSQ